MSDAAPSKPSEGSFIPPVSAPPAAAPPPKPNPAPAGAGTPVRKPADLCGFSFVSICALKRARRRAQHSAWARANSQPQRGSACNDQR